MFVLDTHVDTPSMLLEDIDISHRRERGHIDFPRMKEGGVDGAFFAIYTPKELDEVEASRYAIRLISKVYDAVDSSNGIAKLALCAQDAYRNKDAGKISVFMGMENGSPIGKDLKMLRFFHRMGIRYLTLCHNADNLICDSAASDKHTWGGLSPFGRELVSEMNSLGVLVDVSHTSDDTFYDVLKHSVKPIVATHSCCRSLCTHRRNITDEMLKDMASEGGVIQINFYPFFLQNHFSNPELDKLIDEYELWQKRYREDLKDEVARDKYWSISDTLNNYPSVSYKRIADHVDYAVSLVGTDHVGLGSDFDGIEIAPEGLRDISCYHLILDELRSRGYLESDIEKIAGGNFLRLL
ncbi:MAG: dipeptidase [Alistipes sp.]|nr:dipeptidase [Candidatus Minthomonas equi]